jgi:hypothetical protein
MKALRMDAAVVTPGGESVTPLKGVDTTAGSGMLRR